MALKRITFPTNSPPSPSLQERPLRNCPVGNFREEPDCRGGREGDKGGEFMRIEKEEGKMSSLEKRSYIRVTNPC